MEAFITAKVPYSSLIFGPSYSKTQQPYMIVVDEEPSTVGISQSNLPQSYHANKGKMKSKRSHDHPPYSADD